jgi:hypothetical protein
MKLLIDPLIQSDSANVLGVPWPRSEREPVERMNDLLIGSEPFFEGPDRVARVGKDDGCKRSRADSFN